MTLNPNNYRKTLDAFKPTLLDTPVKILHETIVTLAVASHVPIQAIVAYALRDDVLGPLDALLRLDTSNRKFYGYTEVTPWNDLTSA